LGVILAGRIRLVRIWWRVDLVAIGMSKSIWSGDHRGWVTLLETHLTLTFDFAGQNDNIQLPRTVNKGGPATGLLILT